MPDLYGLSVGARGEIPYVGVWGKWTTGSVYAKFALVSRGAITEQLRCPGARSGSWMRSPQNRLPGPG